MNKRIFIGVFVLLAFVAQTSVLAEDWLKKYDRDHDGRWNYEEFCAWERSRDPHISDRKLHELYRKYDKNHDSHWEQEEAHLYHH